MTLTQGEVGDLKVVATSVTLTTAPIVERAVVDPGTSTSRAAVYVPFAFLLAREWVVAPNLGRFRDRFRHEPTRTEFFSGWEKLDGAPCGLSRTGIRESV